MNDFQRLSGRFYPWIAEAVEQFQVVDYSPAEIIERVIDLPLDFQPGERSPAAYVHAVQWALRDFCDVTVQTPDSIRPSLRVIGRRRDYHPWLLAGLTRLG